MWNPPPPELQISVNQQPSSSLTRVGNSKLNPIKHDNFSKDDIRREPPSSTVNNSFIVDVGNADTNQDNNYGTIVPYGPRSNTIGRPIIKSSTPHPKLEKVGPYITIATLQAYTVLTVVRCLADPAWIVVKTKDKSATSNPTQLAEIGSLERVFLACAIGFTMLSCAGVTLRIMDKLPWLRRIPVITAYLEAIFCIAALISFLTTHTPLPPGGQFSHGFLACIITAVFSSIVAIMLTVDWWRGFPSAGLSATLKALIISSFVMTIVIIIGSAIYTAIEGWTFDEAVNFCIVSFATIGYGNLSPKTSLGQVVFSFYGILGISAVGFFVVSLRNAVIEQFQWRLVEQFSRPAHLTRVQTRMSEKEISFPAARLEEEQHVKAVVKRKMIFRMVSIWLLLWFGGAGVFCAFETWTFLESMYFCFVTLTTIGFGDYVPQQPGSIEFWNVYVFVGLSVFAYILSLSSESMAQHIHLVDDHEDDDSMYGWERNEDPNASLTTRSTTLGLEGLKWFQNQRNMQQTNTNSDDQGNEEGKPGIAPNNTMSNLSENAMENDSSVQSSIQRNRHKERSAKSRILMISAKERKQMLQAEYYATHSLPTTIKFIDTKGVPHQKTFHGGNTRELSEPDSVDDQPTYTYGTIGYYGTIGQRGYDELSRASSMRNIENLSVGVGTHGTMYGSGSVTHTNTVQTRRLQHRPLIKFDSPITTVRGPSGHPRGNRATQFEPEERSERALGSIPSCMDLFSQDKQEEFGSGSANKKNNGKLIVEPPQFTRLRSSSYDHLRSGPSQGVIHGWLAEDAGTLEAPKFMYAYKALEKELDAEFKTSSQVGDTKVIEAPRPSGDISTSSNDDKKGHFHKEDVEYPLEGVAPDAIPVPLTAEPETLSSVEETQFSSGRSTVLIENTSEVNTALAHEPTYPLSLSNESGKKELVNPSNLFLGGGVGAGYGQHAYGVPIPESEAKTSIDTQAAFNSAIQPASPIVNNNGATSSSQEPIQLFDEDDDIHQLTLHSSRSQPLSLFSNHPRSGQNSVNHSPSGSISSTISPPTLMTIFDVPAGDISETRASSRDSSLSAPKRLSRPRMNSSALRISETIDTSGDQEDGESELPPQSQPPSTRGRESSVVCIGPFNETRNPETIPRFDQDVDLNHIDLSSQQIANEKSRREELRRREKEIEARLARLGPKGRADYQS
ncbi:Potassium channel [Entomortierella lignicola]|nr:Potassium channel [Entomortierella lignicola]